MASLEMVFGAMALMSTRNILQASIVLTPVIAVAASGSSGTAGVVLVGEAVAFVGSGASGFSGSPPRAWPTAPR